MVREYELMYIVRPELDDDAVRAAAESVHTLVDTNGGRVHKTTMWGKRRLAYEVKHLRDGHYVVLKLSLDGDRVAVVERALTIHDTVFRHLLVLDEGTPVEETPEAPRGGGERGQRSSSTAAVSTPPASDEANSTAAAPASDIETTVEDEAGDTEPATVGAGVDEEDV